MDINDDYQDADPTEVGVMTPTSKAKRGWSTPWTLSGRVAARGAPRCWLSWIAGHRTM